MEEGRVNRFDDCTYHWEENHGQLIRVIVLMPVEMLAPLRLVREGAHKPEPTPRCVTVKRPPLVLGMADAAEFAALILRQVELGARRGDLPLLDEIQGISFLCDKIVAKVKQKKKPKW